MDNYLKLLLIRHGESMGNKAGRFEGQSSTPLSDQGQWQASQLAKYLKHQFPPTRIYSSPLQRAVETANYLESVTQCPVQLEKALQELHQGILQGLTWAEANERYPDMCAALVATLDYQPIPGAETLMAAHHRAIDWYRTLWQRHETGDVVWMVTHGGFMQYLISAILGCDRSWQIPIRHTALFEFWLLSPKLTDQHNPEHWRIMKFNETPHLGNKIEVVKAL
ncbi:MAG: histidine phosphatase family protein [Leptolyngbyaceae cyanobacterium MAG.088]|nr:histidine phosphatase family protein [Leptolyngbyaceae cyanobacterium MAG.088]